jgi:hypothetical protein
LFAMGEPHELKAKYRGFARMVKIEHRWVTKVRAILLSDENVAPRGTGAGA